MTAVPKNLTKADMYNYIDKLRDKKRLELEEKYRKRSEGLPESAYAKLWDRVEKLDQAHELLDHNYNELIKENPWVAEKLDIYNLKNYLYYQNESLSSRFKRELKKELTAPLPPRNWKKANCDLPIEFRAIEKIQEQYKEELGKVMTLHRELIQIVKVEAYPPKAWRNLLAVGLDLEPLRQEILGRSAKPPAKLATSVNIDLFNK